MGIRRREQRWILDSLIAHGGWDQLHPESVPLFETFGYTHGDIERVFSRVKSTAMLPKAWIETALEVEERARYWERLGLVGAARDAYLRSALLWGRAQYSFYSDHPTKKECHARCVAAFEKVMEYESRFRIERVMLPFEGSHLYGIFELPTRVSSPLPVVLFVPGMDMFKEDWHKVVVDHFLPRGMAAFLLDGPGQGESLVHGLRVTIDNYEGAAATAISYLVSRSEVDASRIASLGISMGSYWNMRIAAYDVRVKAAVTSMACYGPKNIIFNEAQPNYKENFMNMAGFRDEAEFDKFAAHMVLDGLLERIRCPILMSSGEFDELTTLEDTLDVYRRIRAPKELWIWEGQFHPLGPVAPEFFSAAADWIQRALAAEPSGHGGERILYFRRTGDVQELRGGPPRWLGAF